MKRALRAIGWTFTWFIALGCAAWAFGALHYDLPVLKTAVAWAFAVALVAGVVFLRGAWQKLGVPFLGFTLVLAWWLTLKPSNQGNWQPDVARLAWAEIDGDVVTLHNVRNCDYRTETDFDVRHYDKVFDLDRLRTADLFMVYWGSPHMAHTMVSFGFEGGDQLCFSIEARKEKGEGYSAVKGFFRQFELVYIAADERDVVRLRTNYRQGEDPYLFRLNGSPPQVRQMFLDYVVRMNSLRQRPEWYSALTHNCTTSIRTQRAAIATWRPI